LDAVKRKSVPVTPTIDCVSQMTIGDGWFILENTNAVELWPHSMGGFWRRGPYGSVHACLWAL